MSLFATALETVREVQPRLITGRVRSLRGLTVLVDQLRIPIGSIVRIDSAGQQIEPVRGEVVGFEGDAAIVMLYDDASGIAPGDACVGEHNSATVQVGSSLLGRVVDGLGRPLDGRDPASAMSSRPLHPPRLSPLNRESITQPIATGIRVIDGLHTIGRGQRLGVFSGPGVGKSTLIGSIARNTSAEVNVIALVGERGREVVDFINDTLGPEGLARSVVVVATGDESPLLRVRACYYAMCVAEHFRDQGMDVMLTLDSLTRFAHAQRQIGLAVGEQPATKLPLAQKSQVLFQQWRLQFLC
jgi:flagellum-specific ATP synthase